MKTNNEDKKELGRKLISLLQTDPDFRNKFLLILTEGKDGLVTKTYLDIQLAKITNEFKKMLAEQSKEFNEKLNNKIEETEKRLDNKINETNIKIEETEKRLEKKIDETEKKLNSKIDMVVQTLSRKIDILGSRWGLQAEASFLEGMKNILEKEFNAKVQKWEYKGKIPQVNPHREKYEIDVVITDDKVILVEIKGSVYDAEVMKFYENCLAYETIENKKAERKIIVASFVSEDAKELANKYNIEISSR